METLRPGAPTAPHPGSSHRGSVPWTGVGLVSFLVLVGAWWLVADDSWVKVLDFDSVDGLQVGDGVFLQGVQVGRVRKLQLSGRRVLVTIEIEAVYRDVIPSDALHLLWRDPLEPQRRAIRIQPTGNQS